VERETAPHRLRLLPDLLSQLPIYLSLTFSTTMAEPEAAASSTTRAAEELTLEEESTAIFQPVVELREEVKTSTGTENEESIFKMCVRCPTCWMAVLPLFRCPPV